ncbi:MAG: class I SAM-dependent methyltransferase [Thermofilaceae archaeon]|nr:class I SAM-dependent methyltransferase [Thermofilaceae archaeon]MDW8004098.1 class I SAM-dependent methyltransferase [Thermofilaceae archaeon]
MSKSYILRKFLSDPGEALQMWKRAREVDSYVTWRLYTTLKETGLLQKLQEKPWWEFADRDLARWVCDILVEKGYARRSGDVISVSSAPERPQITTMDAADLAPVVDRVMTLLPRALETGEKPNLFEEKAYYSKVAGSLVYKAIIEAAIEEMGLSRLSSEAVVADVFSRIGTSVMTLLEMTPARVIAVEPQPENIEVIKRTVRLSGQENRVSFVQASPEEMVLPEKVDVVFMANVIHWIMNPRLALVRARENLKEKGSVRIIQQVYEGTGLTVPFIHYFFGAVRPPPTKEELIRLIRDVNLKVERQLGSFGIVALRATL